MPGEKDLHPYQKFCVDFLEEKPQCTLFLDCGLGKTIITLTAIAHLLYDSYEVSRILIIAPLRVARDTWIGELSKWEHLKGLRIDFLRVAVDTVVPANVLGQGNSVRKCPAVLPVHVVVELAQQKSRKVKI